MSKTKNKNCPNDINIISPLSALESRKVLYFQKINSLNDINTFGSQPVIVYKKPPKINNQNTKSPNQNIPKNTKKVKNDLNKYISDGNIKKKLQKFNSSSNISHNQNKIVKIKKTKSCGENIVLVENDKKIKEEKERIKNIKEQKLFSKTVRESNMRPVFPKNKNKQFNLTKNGFNSNHTNNSHNNDIENLNLNKDKNKDNSKDEEIKKNIIMNQLVENAVAIEIKKYKNNNNKNSIESIKNSKKREYLEENGINTSTEEITQNENNNQMNIQNNQEKNKKKNSNMSIPRNNNYFSSSDLTHTNIPPKTKNKPSIEQFEFLQKIKNEKKKLLSAYKKNNNLNKYINDNYNYIYNAHTNGYPQQITDSFRKKNRKIYEEKNKITNDKNECSYSLEDKRNHRSTREINEYLREKKIKYKQNEETKQLEKNKKLFLRFKNLYNLNMKDYTEIGKTFKRQTQINTSHTNNNKQRKLKNNNKMNQIEERKDDKIYINKDKNIHPILNKCYNNFNSYANNKINNKLNDNNNNNIRKKKELNEYYIGNDSTLRNNNNSTVVDANEYYLNVLESQQLLVNSKLKKINNETEVNEINVQENLENYKNDEIKNINTDINYYNNNLIVNELCVSKEKIKKITDKEKTRSSNSKKSEEILNTSSIEELKQKINTTLKRANLFFSKEKIENYKINALNNITQYSNSNMKSNDKIISNNDNNMIDNNINDNINNAYEIDKEKENNEKDAKIKEKEKEKEEENAKLNNYLNIEDMKSNTEVKKDTLKMSNTNNIKIDNINIEDINNVNTNLEKNDEKIEKDLTSLSHTYNTNSNPNKKIEIKIEPRAVLNLIEIIKFIIQRKIFVILYESYINHALFQQYNIAFSFFVAICKQYPFKKLEEYYNYKTYNYAFRQLFRPFNRKNFKYFLSCFHIKKKVEYLVILLTKMIKFKTMERIFLYGQYFQEDDEEKAFKMIILKIMYTLIRPHLLEVFNILKNNDIQSNKNNDINKDDSEVNFNISDDDEYINNNIINANNKILNVNNENIENNNNNENIDNKDIKESTDNKENTNNNGNINDNISKSDNDNNNNSNLEEKNIEKSFEKNKENINDNSNNDINYINKNNISDNSIDKHRRKNDSSIKMNSFLYESLDSEDKSSISVEPNSVDNDKLHQLKMILIAKNKNFENGIDDNYINFDNDIDLNCEINNFSHSSKKSEKSLQELINLKSAKNGSKTLSDMMEENSFQKSPSQNSIENLKKSLNNQMDNSKSKEKDSDYFQLKKNYSSSANSIDNKDKNTTLKFEEKDSLKKNEDIKMNNETKDTKEVTDDSNTININTNNKSTKSSGMKTNEINSENKTNGNIIQNDKIDNKIDNTQKIIDDNNNQNKKKDNNNTEENKENINDENKKKGIEIEYNIPRNNLKSKLLKNYKIIEKNDEQNIEIKEINEEKKNNDNEKIFKAENKKIKIPLIKIINDSNDSTSENKYSKEESKESKDSKELKSKNKFNNIYGNKDQFTEELVNEIINKILFSEIKSQKIKILPSKKYKFDKFLKKTNNNNSSQSQNNSLNNSCNSAGNFRDSHKNNTSGLNHLSLHEDLWSLNDSLNSNYSVYSVFNKTIKDKKKEHSLNLYFNKICPKLISYLHKEIIKKYPRIYDNISIQKKNISENLMISLVLQDAQMLRSNYKKLCYKENLDKIIDKKEILKNFTSINRKIRQEDNITSDNYYDNMLNECVLETAIELIEKERFYGENGEPLKWSSRTREISFKYGKNDAKKFADYICKNILKIIHNRIGLINDNYSYMNQDEINYEREKRLLDTIKSDLNRNENQWKNLEMEETQLKVESTEMILDQLYNEVIEILEHIQFNRVNPELYQFKSIYACEEIPKLSFQQTTTEDVGVPEGDENDFMNI